MGIPIFDTLFSMLLRFPERRSLFAPDRSHFHHRLLEMGLNQRRAVTIIYLATAATGARAQVMPVSNREVAAPSAEDIVRMMQLAGFSEEQILELGTDVRNALALSGTAQVKMKDRVEALFSVQGDQIYIVTRSGGSSIYDLTTDRISSPPPLSKPRDLNPSK